MRYVMRPLLVAGSVAALAWAVAGVSSADVLRQNHAADQKNASASEPPGVTESTDGTPDLGRGLDLRRFGNDSRYAEAIGAAQADLSTAAARLEATLRADPQFVAVGIVPASNSIVIYAKKPFSANLLQEAHRVTREGIAVVLAPRQVGRADRARADRAMVDTIAPAYAREGITFPAYGGFSADRDAYYVSARHTSPTPELESRLKREITQELGLPVVVRVSSTNDDYTY